MTKLVKIKLPETPEEAAALIEQSAVLLASALACMDNIGDRVTFDLFAKRVAMIEKQLRKQRGN